MTTDLEGRRQTARSIAQKLERASAPVALIVPTLGIEEWDKEGEPLHDPDGLKAFIDAMRQAVKPPVQLHEVQAHINSASFAAKALVVFDQWVSDGIIPKGQP